MEWNGIELRNGMVFSHAKISILCLPVATTSAFSEDAPMMAYSQNLRITTKLHASSIYIYIYIDIPLTLPRLQVTRNA